MFRRFPRLTGRRFPLKFHIRNIHAGEAHVPTIYKPRRVSLFDPFLFLVGIMPIFTFSLGVWQVKRLKWKVDLIDELEEKLQFAPIVLPKDIDLSSLSDLAFRKVLITGYWDHAHTMLVSPHMRDGVPGVRVVTPFVRSEGSTILVDQGFVPQKHVDKIPLYYQSGLVQILGMIRTAQPKNYFTPENKPDKGEWHWVDTDAMAEFAGGKDALVQPLFVEQIFDDSPVQAAAQLQTGEPVGREATVNIRNSHLSYVITWFSLSAFTTFALLQVLRKRQHRVTRRMPRFS